MRSYKIEGIVINRRNFSESDRIITVFSKTQGKIQIKASGVRKITSRRSPHIELLNYGTFSLHQGRHMPILTEVESLESFSEIKKDLKKVGFSYHILELVNGLCAENQESFEIFMLLGKTLRRISLESNLTQVVRDFEVKLLNLLGFYGVKQELNFNRHMFIENILERKLKTKQFIASFS